MQYQSGYILESVRDALNAYAKGKGKQLELNGLLRSLSTFEVQTNVNLELTASLPSILAVAANIITRGLPTLASVHLEEYFAEQLSITQRHDNAERGKIAFPFLSSEVEKNTGEALFNALHIVEPRARTRREYLNLSNVDSDFERNFLLKFIPEEKACLAQLLEKQRARNTFTRNNNQGRVDFSLEIPYDFSKNRTNRYNGQVQIKHHKTYIVEVDGRQYHTELIDDLKDFEIGQLSRNISHITEDSAYNDAAEFIRVIATEDYIRLIESNYNNSNYLSDALTSLVLAPFGIARLQTIMLRYLMANYGSVSQKESIKIAVVERDLPCARAAIEDLQILLNTLNELAQSQIQIPSLELTVFSTPDFANHKLHKGKRIESLNTLDKSAFDLVIDISILRRTSIFKDDFEPSANTIILRSSHYTHYQTNTGVLSAAPIFYRPLVNQFQNEVYEPIIETSSLLRKFLQDVFRKLDFRVGQLPILNRAVQLKSVIGLLPTGGGKSLTYQLAAILQPGTTIVIDPIRSLMIDQYNGLRELNIDKCEFINSTLTTAERTFNQHELLAKGQLQFLFVSPERFVIDDFRKALDNARKDGHCFAYAVIDEVHCVSEWGHDFRTPYLNLGDNAQKFCLTYNGNSIPLFGLTATASFDVLADIERELNIKEDDGHAVVRFENSVRDEINYSIKEVPCSYEGLDNLNERVIRATIGGGKQDVIFELIGNKEAEFDIFNGAEAIDQAIKHSFRNYLPLANRQKFKEAAGNDSAAESLYASKLFEKLHLSVNPFKFEMKDATRLYQYGLIVFMPHRQGWLGIRNGQYSHGVFDNPEYVFTIPQDQYVKHYYQAETLGYFMGSGDDENASKIDEESFYHLEAFKNNEESVMVATKAFGMGIDKPNVRMTVHINIPQSIESFVQEAGRAGRDGKVSLSVILFNDDQLDLGTKANAPFHLDKDILMYFHKNSFKGQVKERVMIHELRSRITFPNTSSLQMLNDQLNELYGTDDIQFAVKAGSGNHRNRVFINTTSGISIGYVYLDNQNTGIYRDFNNDALCYDLVEWLKKSLPFAHIAGVDNLRNWLDQIVVNTQQQIGLERVMMDMKLGDEKILPIPFTNRYSSKRGRSIDFFNLNQDHFQKVLNTSAVQQLISTNSISGNTLSNLLKDAVSGGLDYLEFVESLKIQNESFAQRLTNLDDDLSLELQRAYFMPRSQEDTAKAIYRLISIGVIDSYTIDYQNKLYTVHFTKKSDDEYYNSLEKLVSRYSSKNVAKREIENLKREATADIKAGKATVISKCLEYLTDFIYGKIKQKRLQAIDDMVRLCQTSITKMDPLEQSTYIKDEIYYYFNAKYSRRGFVERAASGDLSASMPDDLDDEVPVLETINKYLNLVSNEETGEFISNIKHLRGSTMRMLRSYPDEPQFRILKSFALFILADTVRELINEATSELVKGLIDWKHNEDPELNVPAFIILFRKEVERHVLNYDVEKAFDGIEDQYYASYYATWIGTFNQKFLTQ
ncbi:DEAD/DEAH box helicase [Pinibacter soli]|uniref:DNA 3'-5' helicase n=1 Tax=Pinibacter soli TaxID=3044211 RepID=A0ABT6RJG5_9BACT|nr:DEAD/DEAH box helicase [Pinibacter soli]MDI3321977.1 helicase-related protein [Pinibacter soli]